MDNVTKICFFLMLFGLGHTKALKPEIHADGENVIVRIDDLQIIGKEILEINFSGYTSKLHVTNVMLYDPTKNQGETRYINISINRNYTGRITKIDMKNDSFIFLLRNVNFIDSGNYTVFGGSLEKGKTSIIVSRRILLGQHSGPTILPFVCNKTTISSIKIEMIRPIFFPVVIYDVTRANCTEFGNLYMDRIESCLLSENNFLLTVQKVSWLDKGTYVAWDDMSFLLDAVVVEIQEDTKISILKTTKGYVTLSSTANGSLDSSTIDIENEFKPKSSVQGYNVSVSFSGYSSKLHVSNVMLGDPKKDQYDSGYVNRNYTGQIQRIIIKNDRLHFLLLNGTFVDNGDFKGFEKGNGSIFVLRRRLVEQDGKSGTQPFMCNETDTSSIKTDMMQAHVTSPVVINNVGQGKYTYVEKRYAARIQSCVFSGNNVSFTFREVSWLEKTTFAACDDKGFLMDSIFIDVLCASLETTNEYHTLSTGAKPIHDENPKSFLVSAVVLVLVAACLVMIAFWKLRQRRAFAVPNTPTNNITYRNRRKTTANKSCNGYQNVEEAVTPEETRMVSAKNNNSSNLTDFTKNKGQAKVRLNKKSIYSRRLDSAKSSTRTSSNFLTHSLAHEYDYIHENDELKTHCLSYESNLRSKLSSTNSTESIAEPSFEYDYVVQHSFMTLRPPAPYPVVTRKTKEPGRIANARSWCKKVNKMSSSRVDPLTLYADVNKKRARESNCTLSSSELGRRDFINELAPPSYFQLEGVLATDTMHLTTCGQGPNWVNAEYFNPNIFVPRPEFSELRDSKRRSVFQFLNYDYPRSYFDHPSAMDRRHRRSKSHGDMMVIASVRWSRRRSPRTYTKKDCYNSL